MMTTFDRARNEWVDYLVAREEECDEDVAAYKPEPKCTWRCAARMIGGVLLAVGVMALTLGLLVAGGVE